MDIKISRDISTAHSLAPGPASRGAVGGFPAPVLLAHAGAARAVAGGDRGLLVGEEHAVRHLAAAADPAQRARAVEPPVHPRAGVAPECPGGLARVGAAVAAD